jgi:lipopolysaccharide/colanic/teichoic acid biosynthesis glycosyltransferase
MILPAAIPAAVVSGLLAALVRMVDGGPGLFVQHRDWGPDRTIRTIKIRTMATDAERIVASHNDMIQQFGDAGDVRITPLGRWMRRYDIDELPQCVQILTGDLALTGLRPVYRGLVAEKQLRCPRKFDSWYRVYTACRPGLISMSSVLLSESDRKNVRRRMHYDLFYARRAHLGLDLYLCYRLATALGRRLSPPTQPG